MQVNIYNIIYTLDRNKRVLTCSGYSLDKFVRKVIDYGGRILCVVKHKSKYKK